MAFKKVNSIHFQKEGIKFNFNKNNMQLIIIVASLCIYHYYLPNIIQIFLSINYSYKNKSSLRFLNFLLFVTEQNCNRLNVL